MPPGSRDGAERSATSRSAQVAGPARTSGRSRTSTAKIATVERAADVLMCFTTTTQPDLGITEIADRLGLSKAVVHRVLASLRSRGLIDLDERTRRYSLGVATMQLGQAYLARIDVRRMARAHLQVLSRMTNETATLSIQTGPRTRVYVDQVTPAREVIMSVTLGRSFPLHAGASSRVFLAYSCQATIDEYIEQAPLTAVTSATVVDPDELRAQLAAVREQGWARSIGERQHGAASVAAPLLGHDGQVVAVVSVCGPTERFSSEFDSCRDALLATTTVLSRELGWSP